jgi:hypothetical protein
VRLFRAYEGSRAYGRMHPCRPMVQARARKASAICPLALAPDWPRPGNALRHESEPLIAKYANKFRNHADRVLVLSHLQGQKPRIGGLRPRVDLTDKFVRPSDTAYP